MSKCYLYDTKKTIICGKKQDFTVSGLIFPYAVFISPSRTWRYLDLSIVLLPPIVLTFVIYCYSFFSTLAIPDSI